MIDGFLGLQKKKDEEKAREKELNDLFKIAVVQPKVPLGIFLFFLVFSIRLLNF